MASQSIFCCIVVIYYFIVYKISLAWSWIFLEVIFLVEEESTYVSEARPSSTKYKDKWAMETVCEWQRTRTLKSPNLEVGSIFID